MCTHQLKHIFILWHNGELQHTLAVIHTNTQEEEHEEIRCEIQPWSGEKLVHSSKSSRIHNQYSDLVLDAGYEAQRQNKYLWKRNISGSWTEHLLLTAAHSLTHSSLDVVSTWIINTPERHTSMEGYFLAMR